MVFADPILPITLLATDVPADILDISLALYRGDGVEVTPFPFVVSGPATELTGTWTKQWQWKITGIADLAPGDYTILARVWDEDGGSTSSVPIGIQVVQEDAIATYTGVQFVATSSIRTGNATIELRATVQDITAVLGHFDWDPWAGDIRHARVTFIHAATGLPVAPDATGLPVALVDPADRTTGIAAYSWAVNIGDADSVDYGILVRVETGLHSTIVAPSYYFSADDGDYVVVTVSEPLNHAVTGGGYFINEHVAGLYAPDPGLPTNYGFNVKYIPRGAHVQGHVNIILRREGRIYQIKSEAPDYLAVDPNDPRKAEFVAKATLNEVTDPDNPVALFDSLTLIASITDNGEPGFNDTIGLTLLNGNTLLFSSCWDGVNTVERLIDGGNLVVHAELGRTGPPAGGMPTHAASVADLSNVELPTDDLSEDRLGSDIGGGLFLDGDAAGYGWSVDTSQAGGGRGKVDLLGTRPGFLVHQGSLAWVTQRGRESFSANDQPYGNELARKRLLTPSADSTKKYLAGCLSGLTHELGHLLGLGHDVMGADLSPGKDASDSRADVDNAGRQVDRAFAAWQRRRTGEYLADQWLGDSLLDEDLLDAIARGTSD
jgi:hypothetical protein